MANWYLKNVAGQISDTGKQISQKVGSEPVELLKDAQSQVLTPPPDASDKPLVEEILTGSGSKKLTDDEKIKIQNRERQRLHELEAELQKVRSQRRQDLQKYSQDQTELLSPGKEIKPKVFEEPSSKPKSHMLGQVQSKQGTKESGKQYSG